MLVFLVNPETIPAGSGFGFDGVTYARMVAEIDVMIANNELSEYYAQRIVPSLIVRVGLQTLGLPFDAANIIGGFRVLNCLLIVAALGLWMAIAQRMRMSPAGFWIGILGLILIFPNAKQLFYYPVLTDTFAFTIGLAMVWSHLTGRTALTACIAIIGALAWQMTGVIGMVLIASSFLSAGPPDRVRAETIGRPLVITILAVSTLAVLAIGASYLLGLDLERLIFGRQFVSDPFLQLLTNIPVLALAGCFAAYLLACCLAARWRLYGSRSKVIMALLLLTAITVLPSIVIRLIANPEISPPGLSGYGEILKAMLVGRVREGMIFLSVVSHATYYGPLFLIFLLMWRSVLYKTFDMGPAFVLITALFVVLSIFSESRFTFLLWPFVVTVISKTVSELKLSRMSLGLMALGAIGFSKVWLVINQGPWPKPDLAALQEWPKSIYFSSLGPWMSLENYLIQGMIVGLLLIALHFSLRKSYGYESASSTRK